MMKIKKRKKNSRMHGRKMGTHGGGARKKRKKSGHKGGIGMSGSGKRADHKKTLIIKKYGTSYFGKQGVTSRGTERDTRKRINLGDLQNNIESYVRRGLAKKITSGYEVNLDSYKILGTGNIKDKIIINALEASKSALEKVKKAGGEIRLKSNIDKGKKPEETK